jgi:hypothetical protein
VPHRASETVPASAAAAPNRSASTPYLRILLGVLVIAAGLRIGLAAAMPCISRDGAQFCWQARDLGRYGAALLAPQHHADLPVYEQHPLFALVLLGAFRTLRLLGWTDAPTTWVRAGQIVDVYAGLAVVAVCGALGFFLARLLGVGIGADAGGAPAQGPAGRVHPGDVAVWSGLLAAVLPLNNWLSADVMSDQLHAALFLSGLLAFTLAASARISLLGGVFAGLAFLTRPEGVTALLAGLAVIVSRRGQFSPVRWLSLIGCALAGFLVCAAPYWALSGGLSPKLDKEPYLALAGLRSGAERFMVRQYERRSAVHSAPDAGGAARFGYAQDAAGYEPSSTAPELRLPAGSRAALVRRHTTWYEALPIVLYELFRAGRVVIPFVALPVLIALRRALFRPALIGPTSCLLIHAALTGTLVVRHGYLDPRHLLCAVLVLIPLAGLGMAFATEYLRLHGRLAVRAALILATLLPLLAYSLRVPNAGDAFVAEAAARLRAADPLVAGKLLLGGASERRIAFYNEMRFQPWPEDEREPVSRWQAFRDHLVRCAAQYFAIQVGPGRELEGNGELLARLAADQELGPNVRLVAQVSTDRGVEQRVYEIRRKP